MQPTSRLLQNLSRITLFTRVNCSLCDSAKLVLSNVWDKRPFEYKEINVMEPGQEQWRVYEFDVPVIHVEKSLGENNNSKTVPEARKLMHRFKESEVEKLMDDISKEQ